MMEELECESFTIRGGSFLVHPYIVQDYENSSFVRFFLYLF
jgi:hypothetical protein